jgi:hypothetical protein
VAESFGSATWQLDGLLKPKEREWEATMKKYLGTTTLALLPLLMPSITSIAGAGEYSASAITNIASSSDGAMYIRFDNLPDPAPALSGCRGENYHWVWISPQAGDAMKSLALSLYFNGKPVVVYTSGCNTANGAYENVTQIYSPTN